MRGGVVVLVMLGIGLTGWLAGAHGRDDVFDPSLPLHHVPGGGFRNSDGSRMSKSLWEVLSWQVTRQTAPLPAAPLPGAQPDLSAPEPNLTWIGHSTMLIRAGGLVVITDPQFSERASPMSWAGPKRFQPPALQPEQLPHVDVVLISHNHYDHLDTDSVRALHAQAGGPPLFIVPLGLKTWFADQEIDSVVELDWWQAHALRGVEFVLTPSHHWSGRGLADRFESLWGGYAMLAGNLRLIYTGDTGRSRDFIDIRQHFATRASRPGGFDVALIPVGCYEPRAFMRDQHIDPPEAVQIHLDLQARRSIGVHWGTFHGLCDEPLDQAPRDLAAARQAQGLTESDFDVMKVGETRVIRR